MSQQQTPDWTIGLSIIFGEHTKLLLENKHLSTLKVAFLRIYGNPFNFILLASYKSSLQKMSWWKNSTPHHSHCFPPNIKIKLLDFYLLLYYLRVYVLHRLKFKNKCIKIHHQSKITAVDQSRSMTFNLFLNWPNIMKSSATQKNNFYSVWKVHFPIAITFCLIEFFSKFFY